MNTAEYVAEMIDKWTASGAEKWRIAWSAALLCVDWPYVFGAWGAECTPSERRRRKRDDHPTIVSKCQVLNGSRGTCTGCKWFPEGKTVRCFDCRGFTDWCLKQAGIDLKGEGATSQWNTTSNWLRKGPVETMPETTLVCLFVQNGSKMEHTGFGLNNETYECSAGVQHFTKRNKKWTHWAIPRGLYGGDEGNKGTALRVTQPGNDWAVPDVPGAVPDVQLYTVHIPMLPLYKAEALVQSYTGAYMTQESS